MKDISFSNPPTATHTHISSCRVFDFCLLVLSAVGWWCGKLCLFGLLIQADPYPPVCVCVCVHECMCAHRSREHSPMTTTSTTQRQCRQRTTPHAENTHINSTHINAHMHTHTNKTYIQQKNIAHRRKNICMSMCMCVYVCSGPEETFSMCWMSPRGSHSTLIGSLACSVCFHSDRAVTASYHPGRAVNHTGSQPTIRMPCLNQSQHRSRQ